MHNDSVPILNDVSYVINKNATNLYYRELERINKMEEQVLVLPEKIFHEKIGYFEGISRKGRGWQGNPFTAPGVAPYLEYRPRSLMETDPTFKQLIPYSVLTRYDEVQVGYSRCRLPNEVEKKFFVYQRTKKGGESRLHDKWSIGVGGHISLDDGATFSANSYEAGFKRELQEEVGLDKVASEEIVALIYDPSNEVGKVHLGVVHIVSLQDSAKLNFEDLSLANGQWVSYDWLLENKDKFENWSKLVIDLLGD